MKFVNILHLIAFLAVFYFRFVDSNVIGIDFASDSFKVAIVQPGTPLEIGKDL
jgi:hypothetical protein